MLILSISSPPYASHEVERRIPPLASRGYGSNISGEPLGQSNKPDGSDGYL
jgi:hypothetical protein